MKFQEMVVIETECLGEKKFWKVHREQFWRLRIQDSDLSPLDSEERNMAKSHCASNEAVKPLLEPLEHPLH